MANILQNAPTWLSTVDPPHGDYSAQTQALIQAVHQSVLDFALEKDINGNVLGTWNGYRYWMSVTTIVPESPYIFVSNDGQTWQPAPTHASQPYAPNAYSLDNAASYDSLDGIGAVTEDGELVYDPVNNQIVVYMVRTGKAQTTAYGSYIIPNGVVRRTIGSDLLVSAVSSIQPWVKGDPNDVKDTLLYANSPSMVREDATHWHLFGVQQELRNRDGVNRITYHPSVDGITLGAMQYVGDLAGFSAAYPGYVPNHIEAVLNPVIPGQVDLLINAKLTTSDILTDAILVHAVVNLSDPTTITYPLAPHYILRRDPNSWDKIGIYRSGFTLGPQGEEMWMRLWYSGIADPGPNTDSCRTGYTEGAIYRVVDGAVVPIVPPAADTTAPTVTAFTVPATSNTLTVAITALTATDDVAVTGYLVTETAALTGDETWSATAPTEYTFASEGDKTLYAWAKDAAGNVSAAATASVTVAIPAPEPAPTNNSILTVSGSDGGVILTIDGTDGGTVIPVE